MGVVIGIDLGTTNSVMAVVKAGKPVTIPSAEGEMLTPSVVAFNARAKEWLVGIAARRQAIINPVNTIFSVKRFLGRKLGDASISSDVKLSPCKFSAAPNGTVLVKMGEKWCSPVEITARILRKLKTDAETFLGEPVTEAVIAVPAYFDDNQRQATRDAGTIAGFNVLRIISESAAAASAFGLNKQQEETIAVYHLGGGTFDISILITGGFDIGAGTIEVVSVAGDTHLGGDDFDRVILHSLCDAFQKSSGVDLRADKTALQRLREAAEKAKIELSTVQQTEINQPFIATGADGPRHLNAVLTRNVLEQMVTGLVEQTLVPCRQALNDSKRWTTHITRVVLIGGQTRMPLIQERVQQFFGERLSRGINPEEAVAIGAAINGAVLKGELDGVLLLDVTPHTLGIETIGGVATPLVPRNTTIPTSKSQVFSTTADNQSDVEIHVIQGEKPMAADNRTLGRFVLDGIKPAPRGTPQIEVTFDIDGNGILSVRAQDKDTGREQKITIKASSGLSIEEIERLQREVAM
ncbi:MAG: molecular chaperone DnaK [Dehalococcoidales bacterium]|nr:molecular chaperone DnaK [Dehalococcoidales bacterium]